MEAVNYLLHQANLVKELYRNRSEIHVDNQVVSGTVFSLFGANFMYRNMQNVVVMIQGERDDAIMINCHFDSAHGRNRKKQNFELFIIFICSKCRCIRRYC